MKHTLLLFFCAAALLFAATACTQDDLTNGTLPDGEYPLVINATGLQAMATPASRATVDGGRRLPLRHPEQRHRPVLVDKPRGHHRFGVVAIRRNDARCCSKGRPEHEGRL